MDIGIKILLLLATVVIFILVSYGIYKPIKGDESLTWGKAAGIFILLLIMLPAEAFVLLVIMGL